MLRRIAPHLTLCAIVLVGAATASAAPITVPTDLNVGDKYRLVFVTSTTRDATSSDIEDYNAFVASVAAGVPELASLGTTWTAIASTAAVDARDNTGTNPNVETGVPIYRLDDVRVANNNADAWDGELISSIQTDENGTATGPGFVWTGTLFSGQAADLFELGSTISTAVAGNTSQTFTSWVNAQLFLYSDEYQLYAISSEITVEPVPEPSTMTLMAIGATAALGWQFRRRRHRGQRP